MPKLTQKGNEIPIGDYKLTKEERETLIGYDDAANKAVIYTCNRAKQRELKSKEYRVIREDKWSVTFECPKDRISFRSMKKRKVPKEQLQRMKEGKQSGTVSTHKS